MKDPVNKPWGYYVDYFRSDSVVFKKIVVFPNEKLSYQYHNDRNEFWYIESGAGLLTVDGDETFMRPGASILIRSGEKHTVECVGKDGAELIIYEMQIGRPSEDDIVRLEDKYGRN